MTRLPVALRRALDLVQRTEYVLFEYEFDGKMQIGRVEPQPWWNRSTPLNAKLAMRPWMNAEWFAAQVHKLVDLGLANLEELAKDSAGYRRFKVMLTPDGAVQFRRRGKSAAGARRGAIAQVPATSGHPDTLSPSPSTQGDKRAEPGG